MYGNGYIYTKRNDYKPRFIGSELDWEKQPRGGTQKKHPVVYSYQLVEITGGGRTKTLGLALLSRPAPPTATQAFDEERN